MELGLWPTAAFVHLAVAVIFWLLWFFGFFAHAFARTPSLWDLRAGLFQWPRPGREPCGRNRDGSCASVQSFDFLGITARIDAFNSCLNDASGSCAGVPEAAAHAVRSVRDFGHLRRAEYAFKIQC